MHSVCAILKINQGGNTMTSNGFIAFIVAVSASTWLYARFFKKYTMDTKRSAILAAFSFVIVFLFAFIIIGIINKPL